MPEYVVTITQPAAASDAKPVTTERFVRAKNQAQALAHVVDDTIAVKLAETDDVIRVTQAGVKLETAE